MPGHYLGAGIEDACALLTRVLAPADPILEFPPRTDTPRTDTPAPDASTTSPADTSIGAPGAETMQVVREPPTGRTPGQSQA